jgi:SpoVK/Ycf46/Vps4 family AAA+-type ATPase
MQLNVPCIALIEDIDNVFDKRKNISLKNLKNSNTYLNKAKGETKYPLNFDTILNCLDGVDKSDGVFTIITTNDITKIDEAIGIPTNYNKNSHFISSRPGRIDKAIKLTYISRENKIKMANNILEEFPDALKLAISCHTFEKKQTPAQFQEYCANIALKEYWNKIESYKNT